MHLWRAILAHAKLNPDQAAFVIEDGADSPVTIDYRSLVARVTSFAGALRARGVTRGDRALVSCDSSEEFVIGFFSCLLAGVTAVPVASVADAGPPLAQVLTALEDAHPRFVICRADSRKRSIELDSRFEQLEWLSPAATEGRGGSLDAETGETSDPACLLYTSASTARAKGVMLTHEALAEICERVQRLCEYDASSVNVSWTPPYHVTGLICSICLPCYVGCRSVLLPARVFAQRPRAWLEMISKWRGTHSGAPTSCYELCVPEPEKATAKNLDLSSWQVAYLSGEPVRPAPLQRFVDTFQRFGFRPEAIQACYGQSEGFRMAAARARSGLKISSFAAGELEQGRVVEVAPDSSGAVQLAAHGPLEHPRHRIAIMDPETRLPSPAGRIGEIWVKGCGLASGYWNQPENTASTLAVRSATGDGPFVRTGDLGFVHQDNLYLSGRARNLLIVRGRNVHLEDVEETVATAAAPFHPLAIAVSAVELDQSEQLVVFVESTAKEPQLVSRAVREAVARVYGLSVHSVVVLPAGGMPRTAVGKVANAALRNAFLRGELRETHGDVAETAGGADASTHVESELLSCWRKIFGTDAIKTSDSFYALGGDSITLLMLLELCKQRGLLMSAADVTRAANIAELARVVRTSSSVIASPSAPKQRVESIPLLPSQTTMLRVFDHAAACGLPDPTCYPMFAFVRVAKAPIDTGAFKEALGAVMARHEALRVRFVKGADGSWTQALSESPRKPDDIVRDVDLSHLAGAAQKEAIQKLRQAAEQNFDLAEGEVVRATIVRRGSEGNDLVLWQSHHIISDVTTERILHEELTTAYEQLVARRDVELPAPGMALSDWSRHLHQLEQLGVFDDETSYWTDLKRRSERLRPAKYPLPAPISNEYPSAVMPPRVIANGDTYGRLIARTRACGVGVFETMMAVVLRSLERWAGGATCIDLLHNGRTASAVADITRTVGPVFYRFPLFVEDLGKHPIGEAIERVRDYIRSVPNRGIGYSLLGRRQDSTQGVFISGRINYLQPSQETHRSWNNTIWDRTPHNSYQRIAGPLRIGIGHIVNKEVFVEMWGNPALVDPVAIRNNIAQEVEQL